MTSDIRVGGGGGPDVSWTRQVKNGQKMWDVINGCSPSLISISSYVQKVQKYNCLRIELVKNSGTPGIFGDVQLRKFFWFEICSVSKI